MDQANRLPTKNQEWFEMLEIRRRKLNNAVWIPLRASQELESAGEIGSLGYCEEFFGAGSIAVPVGQKTIAETLGWSEIGLTQHKGGIQGDGYVPADVFDGYLSEFTAVALVLAQEGNSDDPEEWHLHQDLVIALGLKREGDTWLAIDEGYIEIARLKRAEGRPVLLEMRAEQLKDYLCARGMALYVTSYRNREEIVVGATHINWAGNPVRKANDGDRWEGRRSEISEGGHAFGSSTRVIHVGRADIDFEEDVPAIGPSDENISSKSWTVKHDGDKFIRVQGELWRNEWVDPSEHSPRIRGDKLPPSVFFITDAKGSRRSAETLESTGGWLWFRPEVIVALSNRRGGALLWYTRDTGGVRSSPTSSFRHFGVNGLGLVNVYAKDIFNLPEWQQKIWAGLNVSPEGGVSKELLAAQAEGQPAKTQAPEAFLPKALNLLNELATSRFGFQLFRQHRDLDALITIVHRFRSTDQVSFFSLAKDIARLTADSIDVGAIQTIVQPPKGEKWGSLKSLENLVAAQTGPESARSMLSPLVGIYELRLADAHLAGSDLDKAFVLAEVDRGQQFIIQGYQLLDSCVSSLYSILKALEKFPARSH